MINSRLLGTVSLITLLTSLLVLATRSAYAVAVYSYQGNTLDVIRDENPPAGTYTTNDFISISFEVPSLLINLNNTFISPTSFSISDGRSTLTDSSSLSVSTFVISTDNNGNISQWGITAVQGPGVANLVVGEQILGISSQGAVPGVITAVDEARVVECTVPGITQSCSQAPSDFAQIKQNEGTWSVVPIPTAVWLFGSGLLGLIGIARRKKAA